MFQSKNISLALFVLFTGFSTLAFNNCSDAQFSPDQKSEMFLLGERPFPTNSDISIEDSTDPSLTDEEVIYDPTEEDIDLVMYQIPQDELEIPKSVGDLEHEPELFEVYSCNDGRSVLICHFPENVESQSSKCIGRNAARSHYNHKRDYDLGNGAKSISDYLGPCRLPL